MSTATPRVPVTIITGFLGAGKTSLLNHLLTGNHGLRLAVLVNDFGAVNIDAGLIRNRNGDVVSLENGCICCSLADGLLASVMRLVRQDAPPDHIVVETSGVSDPVEVANTFADPELQPYAPLDGIATVADAELGPDIDGGAARLARRQIAAADVVVLNKTDLVDQSQLARARAWIRDISENARILETQQGRVPFEMVLDAGGALPGFSRETGRAHDAVQFDSFMFDSEKPLAAERLHAVLQQMPSTIFRAKGFLFLKERPERRCILQATGKRAMVTIGELWRNEPPRNQIVFIGERGGVDGLRLRNQLACEDGAQGL